MDAKLSAQQEKLEQLLKQATAVAVEIQKAEQGPGVPHFDQIELPAHELGKRFSRMVQAERAREVAAAGLGKAACPKCHRKCEVETRTRDVHGMDGPLELTETVAHCSACRRAFFPSA
jgi:hypothetical protein